MAEKACKSCRRIVRGNICPVCKRPLTIGVLNRVDELADRENVNAENEEQLTEELENMELPTGYKEDSFNVEFTEVIKDEK